MSPAVAYYLISTLPTNLHTCFHGRNSASDKFGLLSPPVDECVQGVYDFSANLVGISIILSIFSLFSSVAIYVL